MAFGRWLFPALTTSALALVASAGVVQSEPGGVVLAVKDQSGSVQVIGTFLARADGRTAWAVLEDYDRLPRFVRSLDSSRVIQRSGTELTLLQEGRVRVLFWSRNLRLRLRVHEEPGRRIEFVDTDGRDFESYSGSWNLESAPGGTRVQYSLSARPRFGAPAFVVRRSLDGSTRDLLEEVRGEIERRARTSGR